MKECIDKTELEREYRLLVESEKLNYETFCFTVASLNGEQLDDFFKVAESVCNLLSLIAENREKFKFGQTQKTKKSLSACSAKVVVSIVCLLFDICI